MSKTTVHYARGLCQYAKVFESNRDMGNDTVDHSATDGQYQITLVMDEKQKDNLLKSGVPSKVLGHTLIKQDDEGNFTYRFKRPHKSKYLRDENGGQKIMGQPRVFDYNKTVKACEDAGAPKSELYNYFVDWDVSKDGFIGNGSEVIIKYSVYKGKATIVQLESVGIVKAVKYERDDVAA